MTRRTGLREGFTTGSAAAAAAKAAALALLGREIPAAVDIPLPPPHTGRITVPVVGVADEGPGLARGRVVKDGGDDPDVTHGAVVESLVRLTDDRGIAVDGGRGVGRVTLPGLPVEVGRAAINPAPREQIGLAVREALGLERGAAVLVEVPEGERLARATMNPRLGIVGGISILGTGGIVRPYSHASYEASIREALDVARAAGLDTVVFTTGRRSERFLRAVRPDLPELAVVQAADFFAFATAEAGKRGFRAIGWALFIGKLIKHAQGYAYTHARESAIDFAVVAEVCRQAGVTGAPLDEIKGAILARRVGDLIETGGRKWEVLGALTDMALRQARKLAGPGPHLGYYLFDFDGSLAMLQEDGGKGA